jgi:hypothetical protein
MTERFVFGTSYIYLQGLFRVKDRNLKNGKQPQKFEELNFQLQTAVSEWIVRTRVLVRSVGGEGPTNDPWRKLLGS